jgi:Methyltransferase domain
MADPRAEAESAITRYLRDHPEVERDLLDAPLAALNGADAFLRAQVVEERQGFAAARDAYAYADEQTYDAGVRSARSAVLGRVVEIARDADRVVDVATGRGMLLELLVGATDAPIVATDISPAVLGRVRNRLGSGRVEYVVADAQSLPFDDDSVPLLVSHLGLANMPVEAMRELRRVGRELAATHVFYPARAAGDVAMVVREHALTALADAGWDVTIEAERTVRSRPTPLSALIEGVRIDTVPTEDAPGTWCVVRAR